MPKNIEYKFEPIKNKMEEAGLPQLQIKAFKHYYTNLIEKGKSEGKIPEETIKPVKSLPKFNALDNEHNKAGEKALDRTVMIKLNGGLGTSMGLDKAKSLLEVKNGYSFLDIIIQQALRDEIPLVLMNSFRTREESIEVMKQYPELQKNIPFDFCQHKVPKILQSDLSPAESDRNPENEWCPPGHGDIYNSLLTSGMLEKLIEAGYEYAFISNSDNLGGVLDKSILGYFVQNEMPFLMEVARRTPADKKGGHLARRKKDGNLILREISQCPDKDIEEFQNISKYRYFNTNNLWINLTKLGEKLEQADKGLILPLICNEKHLNPRDRSTPEVFQLETAMGAAISVFEGAGAIKVPKHRFIPVKKTNSLLNIRSDNYILTQDYEVKKNPARKIEADCDVELDPEYYKFIDQLENRFPHGPPSLIKCKSFQVEGDVVFGKNISCAGEVNVENHKGQKKLEEEVLKGKIRL